MKKFLGVSVMAMLVSMPAFADIASTSYVDNITGAVTDLQTTEKGNLVAAINSIKAGATAVQSVTTGTTNGTVAVDGTDVPVKGLGSAAYQDSTAFEPAGTASSAIAALNLGDTYVAKSSVETSDSTWNEDSTTMVPSIKTAVAIADAAVTTVNADLNSIKTDKQNNYGVNDATLNLKIGSGTAEPVSSTNSGDAATFTIPSATNAAEGVIKIATDAEVTAGTSATTAVNPQQLAKKQNAITSTAPLGADLVDDTNSTHKFVTAADKTALSNLGTNLGNKQDKSTAAYQVGTGSGTWSTLNSLAATAQTASTVNSTKKCGDANVKCMLVVVGSGTPTWEVVAE